MSVRGGMFLSSSIVAGGRSRCECEFVWWSRNFERGMYDVCLNLRRSRLMSVVDLLNVVGV